VISHGAVTPVVDLPGVAAVEYANGSLYASTVPPFDENGNPVGTGTVVRIDM
jgi:hypothetical protein